MKSKGIDLALTSNNLTGDFSWSTVFNFNYATEKVTRYDVPKIISANIKGNEVYPLVGYPLYSIFSVYS